MIKVGSRVENPKKKGWGTGIVERIEEDYISVKFQYIGYKMFAKAEDHSQSINKLQEIN